MRHHILRLITATILSQSASSLAVTLPSEFESAARQVDPLFAYFGSVSNITITPSVNVAYSGGSNEVLIAWQPDQFFTTGGASVGDRFISGVDLNIPSNALWFSLSVQAPSTGTVSLKIVLREDDNNDGLIEPLSSDDEWTSPIFFLEPGRSVYNIPLADFVDTNVEGNGIQGFTTTGAMGIEISIETSSLYPGGMVIAPASYFIDHLGLYNAPQTLPVSTRADLNLDNTINGADLGLLLGSWGLCSTGCNADLNFDTVVDGSDLGLLLGSWNADL
jgi:hypothetical protein